jgi:predicted glycosyltransferase
MRVWIDLSNSPHPLLFAPISRRLQGEGHEVLVTARDNAQTVELAYERWPEAQVIGGESPASWGTKAATIGRRMRNLRSWARARRLDVALSHNSYAQIAAARSLGIPAVTAMDFEHQPANHLAFRLASTILLPEALSPAAVRRQGAAQLKVVRYPGLKEELYIGDFEPDSEILARLGIERHPRTIVIVARSPPSRATYHHFENSLFGEALRVVCSRADTVCVVLARHREQVAALERLELPGCTVPAGAIDSRSLIYASDLMLGAGGTMTREAALMGIPTWTLFAGRPPSVDLWLEERGLLARLERVEQLNLAPRSAQPRSIASLAARGAAVEQVFVEAVSAVAARLPSASADMKR